MCLNHIPRKCAQCKLPTRTHPYRICGRISVQCKCPTRTHPDRICGKCRKTPPDQCKCPVGPTPTGFAGGGSSFTRSPAWARGFPCTVLVTAHLPALTTGFHIVRVRQLLPQGLSVFTSVPPGTLTIPASASLASLARPDPEPHASPTCHPCAVTPAPLPTSLPCTVSSGGYPAPSHPPSARPPPPPSIPSPRPTGADTLHTVPGVWVVGVWVRLRPLGGLV